MGYRTTQRSTPAGDPLGAAPGLPCETDRWTTQRKAALAIAVRACHVALDIVCQRYKPFRRWIYRLRTRSGPVWRHGSFAPLHIWSFVRPRCVRPA